MHVENLRILGWPRLRANAFLVRRLRSRTIGFLASTSLISLTMVAAPVTFHLDDTWMTISTALASDGDDDGDGDDGADGGGEGDDGGNDGNVAGNESDLNSWAQWLEQMASGVSAFTNRERIN